MKNPRRNGMNHGEIKVIDISIPSDLKIYKPFVTVQSATRIYYSNGSKKYLYVFNTLGT